MQPNCLQVEMKIDDLAKFVYIENVNNARIDLNIHGLQDVKDLFCFCIDMMCKGLVHICSKTTKAVSIDLDSITNEQFSNVANKLSCTGIIVKLVVESNDTGMAPSVTMGDEFNDVSPPLLLKDYSFFITTIKNMYIINFDILTH
jgi:hypothetical protein